MKRLEKLNNRDVFYLDLKQSTDLADLLPNDNWLALIITDNRDLTKAQTIANACLSQNVKYICTLGSECEWLHDYFDEAIVVRRISLGLPVEKQDDFEDAPMTTWHNDFDEGFWFALMAANSDSQPIDKVICINLSDTNQNLHLNNLLLKFIDGWIPPG